jgi:hypothetical protein
VAFVQTFATLEIIHALLGWVKTPLPTTLMQVSSRLYSVWGVYQHYPQVRYLVSQLICVALIMAMAGSLESLLCQHASCLVSDGGHSVLLLRVHLARKDPFLALVVAIHDLLSALSHWCNFRSGGYLLYSADLSTVEDV